MQRTVFYELTRDQWHTSRYTSSREPTGVRYGLMIFYGKYKIPQFSSK